MEAVLPKSVVRNRLTEFADIHGVASAEFDALYRVCDGLPFGMTLYDDEHVGLRAYDDTSGALFEFVDTADPEAAD